MNFAPALLLCFISVISLSSALSYADDTCFPECRTGFVCSPAGTCVSSCNPVCDPGQYCEEGACHLLAVETTTPLPNSVPPQPKRIPQPQDATLHKQKVLQLQAGFIYQFLDTEQAEVIGAAGLQLAALIFPTGRPFFVRPRIMVIFGDDKFYEPSIDFGVEWKKANERIAGKIQVAAVIGLWPSFSGVTESFDQEPIGPYLGVSVTPMLDFGNFQMGLHLERGYQLATDPNHRATTLGFLLGLSL